MHRYGRLTLAASLLLFTLCGGAFGASLSSRPNIILIVMDTVRYDATVSADDLGPVAPFLASLRSRAVVFTNAYSTHDFTPPSHYSMLTGFHDGLGGDDDRVENGVPWQLSQAGFDTFGVAANGLLSANQMPVLRGFRSFNQFTGIDGSTEDRMNALLAIDARAAMFRCRPTEHVRSILYYSAERLLPVLADRIRHAKPPYFGFVNLLDAHEPYVPDPSTYTPERDLPEGFDGDVLSRKLPNTLLHPELIDDAKTREEVRRRLALVKFPHLLADDLTPKALAIYHRRYLAKVRQLDSALKTSIEQLQKDHLLDNTILIITSDHGESFGEDGFVTHMLGDHGGAEATRHVPLLVILPPNMHREQAVVDRLVNLAMVAPTIYEFAGVDATPLRQQNDAFAPSLARYISTPVRPTAQVRVVSRAPQNHSTDLREREKALRSLGYVH